MTSRRFHIVLDAENCNRVLLVDKKFIELLIITIAAQIEMTIIHGPTIIKGVDDNPGLTAFAIVDFSHISIHTFTKTNEMCLDVFSCKFFDYKALYDLVKIAFKLEDKDIRRAVVTYNGRPKL